MLLTSNQPSLTGTPVSSVNYIYPPRAKEAIPFADTDIFQQLNWTAQLKYNDSRCLIKHKPGQPLELWSRHATKLAYQAQPHLIDQLNETITKLNPNAENWTLLDGGLLHNKHKAIKDSIVIWDILVLNGKHLLNTTYAHRYDFLLGKLTNDTSWHYTGGKEPIDFGLKINEDLLIPRCYNYGWDELWANIEAINAPHTTGKPGDKNYDLKPLIEGLMFKDPLGKLERGLKEMNNSTWQCRSRVHTGRHRF